MVLTQSRSALGCSGGGSKAQTKNGGERGIRTLETVTRLHTFQACAFDHSATSPIILKPDQKIRTKINHG